MENFGFFSVWTSGARRGARIAASTVIDPRVRGRVLEVLVRVDEERVRPCDESLVLTEEDFAELWRECREAVTRGVERSLFPAFGSIDGALTRQLEADLRNPATEGLSVSLFDLELAALADEVLFRKSRGWGRFSTEFCNLDELRVGFTGKRLGDSWMDLSDLADEELVEATIAVGLDLTIDRL